jgi:hypothetical protein
VHVFDRYASDSLAVPALIFYVHVAMPRKCAGNVHSVAG